MWVPAGLVYLLAGLILLAGWLRRVERPLALSRGVTPVARILPGHGRPFTGLDRRIDEILAHHAHRKAKILRLLGEGETTVGTRVDVTHVGTARAGEKVTVRIRLDKVTQRRLLGFAVEVEAPAGVISTGFHQRLVIDRSRFS